MHAGKKGKGACLGEVDGDIPEAKLKEFQAEWRKRQPRGQDDGSEQGVGARGRRAAKARGVGEGEGGRGQEAEGGKGREEGVGGGKVSAARRVQAAEAAVARAAQAVQSGIGDADAVERRRQLAADQAVAGTENLFGASRRDALREALERGRREQATPQAARLREPLVQTSTVSRPGSLAQELPEIGRPVRDTGEAAEAVAGSAPEGRSVASAGSTAVAAVVPSIGERSDHETVGEGAAGGTRPLREFAQTVGSGTELAEEVVDAEEVLGYLGSASLPQDRRVASLRNVGNTCYLNAVLNALASVPLVARWACAHERAVRNSPRHDCDHCTLCLLGRDIRQIRASEDHAPLLPSIVRERGQWSRRSNHGPGVFDNVRQQDANEAFNILMDRADQVDWNAFSALVPEAAGQSPGQTSARYSTPYYKIFGGVLRRRMKCQLCNFEILAAQDSFASLAIELSATTSSARVEELVEGSLCKAETPDEYKCRGCGRSGTTRTSIEVVHWPQVLCVQLKRFEWLPLQGRSRKISTRVNWQERERLRGGAGACDYRLRCLCNHNGVAYGGHYTSYVRGHGGTWYLCDDGVRPRRVELSEVLECQGYMAFYEKEAAVPEGGAGAGGGAEDGC